VAAAAGGAVGTSAAAGAPPPGSGGGLLSGFAQISASAFDGLAAQQRAASLISGEGGPEGTVVQGPGGGLWGPRGGVSSAGGWLAACLPLTETCTGQAYRP